MHFLIDASLPRSVGPLLRGLGHETIDVRDVGRSLQLDAQIAEFARANGFMLVTADFDFADIRQYPPSDYFGIVVIDRPENAKVAEVLEMVGRFVADPQRIVVMTGRLAIVSVDRIRVRPPLPETTP